MAYNWKSKQNDDIIIDRDSFNLKLEMKRWKNECSLTMDIAVPTTDPIKLESAKKLKYKSTDFDVIFDKKDPYFDKDKNIRCESGGIEFTIVLKKKPLSNKWTIPIKSKNLQFWYQPSLTQKEIDMGFNRPEDVVGSYAVYKINRKKAYSDEVEAEKYKVGKVFHIYRPKVIDNSPIPKEIWADLNIDNNVLTITVEQDFLNTAKYPVYIDPTFGYESTGGSGANIDDIQYGVEYPNTAGVGDATKLTAYFKRDVGITSHRVKAAVYDAADPVGYVQGTDEISDVGTTAGWKDLNFSTQPSISDSTSYTLVVWGSVDGGSGNLNAYFDTNGDSDCVGIVVAYNGWPATIEIRTETWDFSIYCTFSVTAYTLACAAGSYAITGTALTPLHDMKLGCAAGSYAVTGTAMSPLHDKIISLGSGSYVIVGKDVALVYSEGVVLIFGSQLRIFMDMGMT